MGSALGAEIARIRAGADQDTSVTEIETSRLLFAPMENEDLAPYARICADPEVMKYLSGAMTPKQSEEQVSEFVSHWKERGFGLWPVEEKSTYRLTHRISHRSKRPSEKIKAILRKLEARTQETLMEAIGQALDAVSHRDALGRFSHCGYRLTDQLA